MHRAGATELSSWGTPAAGEVLLAEAVGVLLLAAVGVLLLAAVGVLLLAAVGVLPLVDVLLLAAVGAAPPSGVTYCTGCCSTWLPGMAKVQPLMGPLNT